MSPPDLVSSWYTSGQLGCPVKSRPNARRRFVIADPIHPILNLDPLHGTPGGHKVSLRSSRRGNRSPDRKVSPKHRLYSILILIQSYGRVAGEHFKSAARTLCRTEKHL